MTGVMDLKMGEGSDTMTMKAGIKGRWLGADCGDLGERDDGGDDSDEGEL